MTTVIRCYKNKHEPTLTLQFRNPATGKQVALQKTELEAQEIERSLIASGKWRVTESLSPGGLWGAVRWELLEKDNE